MFAGFESLVEERILKAQKNGELDNLPGQGKPLNLDDMSIPEEFRMVHRILKNSGFLPPEVELRKQIRELEDMLRTIDEQSQSQTEFENKVDPQRDSIDSADFQKRKHIQKRLDFLILKLNTNRGSSSSPFTFSSQYRQKLLKRML